jgi:hypothetical protein
MIERELLHAYCDGELSPAERAQIEATLKQDAQAVVELQAIRHTKELISSNVRPMNDEALWRQCVGRLDEIDKTKKVEGFVSRYAWGLCAVFLFVILGGGVLHKMNPNSVRAGQVASYVSGMGLTGGWSKPPAQASDRRQWLDQQLGPVSNAFRSDVIHVEAGKREITDDGHQVTCLLLADDRGFLKLVVVSNFGSIEGSDQPGQIQEGEVNEMNYVAWNLNNCALYLVGDARERTQEELSQIASNIRVH